MTQHECAASRHYLLVTVTFVLVASPCYANHIYREVNGESLFILSLIQAIVQPLHGLFTFIIFSLNKAMLGEYRKVFARKHEKNDTQTEQSGLNKVEMGAMVQQLDAYREQIVLLQQAREAIMISNPGGIDLLDINKESDVNCTYFLGFLHVR